MDQRRKVRFRQQFHQLDQSGEVGPIDQIVIGLKRIGAISNAIEDRARVNVGHQVARCCEINEISFQNVTTINPVEAPGGERANNAENVLAVSEQAAQKVGSDE